MAYLTEEKFDLKEITTILNGVMPDVDSFSISPSNSEQVKDALAAFKDFLVMRNRKRRAEDEDYRIANKATFSWKTTKAFHENPIFEDDDDPNVMWWEKPELSREKKVERLRAAERDVKFELSNRKFLLQNKAKALPYSRTFQNQDRGYGSFQRRPPYPQGRSDSRRCHWCQAVGHIVRNCPIKSQQQQPRNFTQPGHGKTRPMGNDNN